MPSSPKVWGVNGPAAIVECLAHDREAGRAESGLAVDAEK